MNRSENQRPRNRKRAGRSRSRDLAKYKICVSSDRGRYFHDVLTGARKAPIHNWTVLADADTNQARLVKNWVRTLYALVWSVREALARLDLLAPDATFGEYSAFFENAAGTDIAQMHLSQNNISITIYGLPDVGAFPLNRTTYTWDSAPGEKLRLSQPHSETSITMSPGVPLEHHNKPQHETLVRTIERSNNETKCFVAISHTHVATGSVPAMLRARGVTWLLDQEDTRTHEPAFGATLQLALYRAW